MSRSKRGAKAAGYEYWGRRLGVRNGVPPGPITKRRTTRRERRHGKREERAP